MSAKLVRLRFGRNVAHFGELGIGIEETSERVRSDTLFSAWLSAYAKLLGKHAVEQLLEQFKEQSDLPFRLSSTFIWQKIDDNFVYYLPRPLAFPRNYPVGDDLSFTKTYKALKYLPLDVWRHWYQGEGFTESDREQLIAKTIKDKSGYEGKELDRAGTFDYSKAYQFYKLPKIAVDRTTRATNLYHTGVVQFNNKLETNKPETEESLAGLYFLVQFADENSDVANDFFAVLDFLGGEGIGGERSSGAGQFKVDRSEVKPLKEDFELTEQWQKVLNFQNANAHSLISLFWTDDTDHLDSLFSVTPEASYELQERGGWIASPCSDGRQMRRQAVQMFMEGSVFPESPIGKLADVTPSGFTDHKIYRSGISLSLPIKAQEP
ncbi:type III-A CRISPR-associated RAMP protein Csm4 [Kovacikia minuta CCNUW1]|uniref:type III-A CRISPR-associated RAMP protein Csm4 n=1 Tax=Kovacikia minuta TaxID=2931930 RepID=UPI001CCE7305|nr:type III-A CRISPR-associated RAMP protein Csm4 [Kovacikia minuta]UBF28006.1 type III-A CRISPR-associated RAMP protein Csm4 [Kovacikia minuta CCNUW1]